MSDSAQLLDTSIIALQNDTSNSLSLDKNTENDLDKLADLTSKVLGFLQGTPVRAIVISAVVCTSESMFYRTTTNLSPAESMVDHPHHIPLLRPEKQEPSSHKQEISPHPARACDTTSMARRHHLLYSASS